MSSPTPSQLRAQALRGLSSPELYEIVSAANRSLGPGRHPHRHVEHALERALAMLRGAPRALAARLFARALAAELLEGLIAPTTGCDRLAQLARAVPQALDAHPWVELQDELHLAEEGALGREGVEERIREAARELLGR